MKTLYLINTAPYIKQQTCWRPVDSCQRREYVALEALEEKLIGKRGGSFQGKENAQGFALQARLAMERGMRLLGVSWNLDREY